MRTMILLPLLFSAGCIGRADVMLPHPLTGHAFSPKESEIEKPLSGLESQNGLPLGSMSQRAKMTKLDDQQACFSVELHSLDAEYVNVRGLTTILKAQPSGDHVKGATVSEARTDSHVYEGLVPHQVPSGTENYCAQRDATTNVCNSWRTRTLYTTTMIPGPVTVYSGSANVCFTHEGVVNKRSQRVILDLHKITMVGFMPQKAGFDFRWGFTGAVTDKSEAAAKSDKTGSAKPKDDDADLDAKMEQAMNEKKATAAADREESTSSRAKKPTRRARVTRPRPRES